MFVEAEQRRSPDRVTGIALALGLGIVMIPLLITATPPLTDFPNHLTRFWLIAGGERLTPLDQMYRIDWRQASTNIGLDRMVQLLSPLLSFDGVVKLILILALIGPPAGAMLLNRRVFGRIHGWQIAALYLVWTTTALAGFISYQAALALALFAACLEPDLAHRPVIALVARMAFAGLLLLFHPFGLVFYAALIAGLAVGPDWGALRDPSRLWKIVRGLASAMAALGIAAALFYLAAPVQPGAYEAQYQAAPTWAPFNLVTVVLNLFSPVLTYDRALDLLSFSPLLILIVSAVVLRRLRAHAGLVLCGAGLTGLALVMPSTLGDAAWLDRRLPLMAALTLFAGVQPRFGESAAARAWLDLFMLAVVGFKTAWIARVWSAREGDVRSIARALDHVPAGAALLAVQTIPRVQADQSVGRYLMGARPDRVAATLAHMPDLAVSRRRAFMPTLFAIPGQQPLTVLPPWSQIATPSSTLPDIHELDSQPGGTQDRFHGYMRDWRGRFDYLIVLEADQEDFDGPWRPSSSLTLVADEHFARLYRINR